MNLAKHDQRDVRDWIKSVKVNRDEARIRRLVEPAIVGLRPELDAKMQLRMRLSIGHALHWAWKQETGSGWPEPPVELDLVYAQARAVAALFRSAKIMLSVAEQYAAQAVHRAWTAADGKAERDESVLVAAAKWAHEHWPDIQAEQQAVAGRATRQTPASAILVDYPAAPRLDGITPNRFDG